VAVDLAKTLYINFANPITDDSQFIAYVYLRIVSQKMSYSIDMSVIEVDSVYCTHHPRCSLKEPD